MTALAAVLALVGLAFVAAVWDALRRGLAAQVRLAELRVEAVRRVERVDLDGKIEKLVARLNTLEREHQTLDTQLAIGRRGR